MCPKALRRTNNPNITRNYHIRKLTQNILTSKKGRAKKTKLTLKIKHAHAPAHLHIISRLLFRLLERIDTQS